MSLTHSRLCFLHSALSFEECTSHSRRGNTITVHQLCEDARNAQKWRNLSPVVRALSTARAQCLSQKISCELKTNRINSMAKPRADMPFDRHPCRGERLPGEMKGFDGNEVVDFPVYQLDRRSGLDLGGEMLGASQQSRKPHYAGNLFVTAQPHMKGHHRPLAEANEGQSVRRQLV